MPRARRTAHGRASLVALTACAVSLGGWTAAGGSGWPPSGLEAKYGDRLMWLAPELPPIAVAGELDSADVLVVGDSRAAHAVHLSITDSLGLGEVAIVWLASARLEDLLRTLQVVERPRDLVIVLAPVALVAVQRDLAIGETLRAPNPAADPASPPRLVREWLARELEHLLGKGFAPFHAERTLAWWSTNYTLRHAKWRAEQRPWNTRGLDLALAHRVDRARALAVWPVEPQVWQVGWRHEVDPRACDRNYRLVADASRAEERRRSVEVLTGLLREFRARGWRVACVRLPIDPELRRIEDQSGCVPLFEELVRAVDLPFRDFGAWPDATFDGSHLHWPAADRLTRELGQWLRDDVGWSRRTD